MCGIQISGQVEIYMLSHREKKVFIEIRVDRHTNLLYFDRIFNKIIMNQFYIEYNYR